MAEKDYRLIIFDAPDDPRALRDLFQAVLGLHPTEAMQWAKRTPGLFPWPLAEGEVRELLDGLYDQGIAAEARRLDTVPKLTPPKSVHIAACLEDGLKIGGLRGEPTHWVPWPKLELIHGGWLLGAEGEGRETPSGVMGALATGLNAMILRRPPATRPEKKPRRSVKEPTTELHLVRTEPRLAFRIVADQMNYSYLGDRLKTAASENFPIFLNDLCARATEATITPSVQALRDSSGDTEPAAYPDSQTMIEDTTLILLWSWYRKDRDRDLEAPPDEPDAPDGSEL